jgi:hypothetical protein
VTSGSFRDSAIEIIAIKDIDEDGAMIYDIILCIDNNI